MSPCCIGVERRIAVAQFGDVLVMCSHPRSSRLGNDTQAQARAQLSCTRTDSRRDPCADADQGSSTTNFDSSCDEDTSESSNNGSSGVLSSDDGSGGASDGGETTCADASALVAVKRISLPLLYEVKASGYTVEDPIQEARVATAIAAMGNHANIVQFFDVYVANDCLHMVMEFCAEGDLLNWVERRRGGGAAMSERVALAVTLQIARALEFLHCQVGIAHRDVSLENVFVTTSASDDDNDDGTNSNQGLDAGCDSTQRAHGSKEERSGVAIVCKLGDFGLSIAAKERPHECVGKMVYMAPEVVARRPYDPCRADVWSLGIVLFILLTGSPLIEVASTEKAPFIGFCRLGVHGVLEAWGMLSHYRSETLDLCDAMLRVDPTKRADIRGVLRHTAWTASGVV